MTTKKTTTKRLALLIVAVVVAAGLSAAVAVRASGTTAHGSSDAQAIRALYANYSRNVAARNLAGIMSLYAPGRRLVAFDAFGPPSQTVGSAAYVRGFHYGKYFALFPGQIREAISNLQVVTSNTLSYAYGYDHWTATPKGGSRPLTQVYRFTDVFQKIGGRWLIVHEHLSFPVDPRSLKAVILSSR